MRNNTCFYQDSLKGHERSYGSWTAIYFVQSCWTAYEEWFMDCEL